MDAQNKQLFCGAGAAAEDGSVGEMVNPMLRLKLKGKPRRKAGAFAADIATPKCLPCVQICVH
jgi:hypothetical protein